MSRRVLSCVWLFSLALTGSPAGLQAQDNWPRFRGATAAGVAIDDPRLPEHWSTTENVRWTAEIPGWGWGSPIVWGDRLFVTSVVSDQEYERPQKGLYLGQGRQKPPDGIHRWWVYCLHRETGEMLWKQEVHQGEPQIPRHPKSTYASETPATDGERLYVLFGDVGLYCFDMQGQQLWTHPIEAKKTLMGYGAASSPIVHEGQVIYVYDNQEASYIACLDGATGETRWQRERDENSTWATPCVWQRDSTTEIVVAGRKAIRGYDLQGDLRWDLTGPMSNLVIPSPFASHGLLYVTSGYVGDRERPVYVLRPDIEGHVAMPDTVTAETELPPAIAWYLPQAGPYNPSPIVYGDYYYTVFDRGFLTCHNARTGEVVYDKQRFAPGASFTASPVAYNGKLFCTSEDGDTYVIAAGPEYKILATNSLSELTMACPAVAQGNLFIRTASKIYCLGQP